MPLVQASWVRSLNLTPRHLKKEKKKRYWSLWHSKRKQSDIPAAWAPQWSPKPLITDCLHAVLLGSGKMSVTAGIYTSLAFCAQRNGWEPSSNWQSAHRLCRLTSEVSSWVFWWLGNPWSSHEQATPRRLQLFHTFAACTSPGATAHQGCGRWIFMPACLGLRSLEGNPGCCWSTIFNECLMITPSLASAFKKQMQHLQCSLPSPSPLFRVSIESVKHANWSCRQKKHFLSLWSAKSRGRKWKWLGVMAPKRPDKQGNNQLHMSHF